MRRLALGLVWLALAGQGRSGGVRADEPTLPSAAPVVMDQIPVQESMLPGDGEVSPAGPARNRPVHDWLRNHPWGCWATHNSLGCGSLKAECTFIFGSCRAFYGEPCFKGPPPSPPGVPDAGAGRCGCP